MNTELKNGRGAQSKPTNRFEKHSHEWDAEYLEFARLEGEEIESKKTKFITVHPKTILTANNSPDVPFKWSINPYQGCEHGCVYCYARNSHEYWGYSAGEEFEKVILVKESAPELLRKTLSKKSWQPEFIALSGNTDCYQPCERKYGVTRKILEVMNECNHPVGIITKNALLLRDLDLLKELNKKNLLRVTLSITTLDENLRRVLEPRTSSVKKRLETLEILTENGIEVNVNIAPMIPGLNSHEIMNLAKEVGKRGAYRMAYIMVRLNGQIGEIFTDWVKKAYPQRAEKVLNHIRETHNGTLNDSTWKHRMRGSGTIAEQVRDMFHVATRKYIQTKELEPLDYSKFKHPRLDGQLGMF